MYIGNDEEDTYIVFLALQNFLSALAIENEEMHHNICNSTLYILHALNL